jgi:PAS domain S-box-containing protein
LTVGPDPFTLALAVPRITPLSARPPVAPSVSARTIAAVLDTAVDVDAALRDLLRLVCEQGGWPVGQAWMPRADGSGLEWRAGWSADPRYAAFHEASRVLVFAADALLPGRAWTARAAVGLPELASEPEFLRAPAAQLLGLRSAVAVPLADAHGVSAVFELLSADPRAGTDAVVDLAQSVAPAFFTFLERRRERAQRESEDRLRSLFDSRTIGIVFWDRDGRIRDANQAFLDTVGYSPEDLASGALSWERLSLGAERLDQAVARQIETVGVCPPFESDCARKDGQRVPVLIGGGFTPESGGLVCYLLDVTEQRRVRDALRESEERFRAFMDHSPVVAFMKDAGGRHLYYNATWRRMFDNAPEAGTCTDFDLFPAEVAEHLRANDQAVLSGGRPQEFWEHVPTGDGVLREWLVLKFPFESTVSGRMLGGVALDMTERRRVDAALHASEERYRNLVEHSPDAIFLMSDMRVTFVNAAGVRLLRASEAGGIVGKTAFDVVHSDHHAMVRERLRLLTERGHLSSRSLELRFVRLDGSLVDVEVFALPLDASDLVQVVARDITERKQAEHERARLLALEQSARAESVALSRRVVEAQESERQAIARELHDEIGQMLTGLSLILKSGTPPPGPWRERFTEAQKLLYDLTRRVREMSLDLRPAMLDDLGLLAALLWQTERYQYQTKIRLRFHHFGLEDRRFPAELETVAYRLVQEALTNVARHSKASEADVHVRAEASALWVRVSDRGKGFDPAQMGFTGSMGLFGMRERVAALGGELRIDSSPGQGTSLTAWLPLPGTRAATERPS